MSDNNDSKTQDKCELCKGTGKIEIPNYIAGMIIFGGAPIPFGTITVTCHKCKGTMDYQRSD